jgi:hypothetical protein
MRINAAEYIHKCGFSRPVLSDNSVNLTRLYAEIDIVECLSTRENLRYILHSQ